MDWNNVTWWELLSALCEAEWRQGPQPLWEFVQPARFSLPKTRRKWAARLKNNLFYYHVNYILLVVVAICAALLRRPWSVPPAVALAAAAAVQNDTFAAAASEAVLRGLRRLHGRAAARLRRAAGGGNTAGIGHPPLPGASAGRVTICGLQRRWVASALSALGLLGLCPQGTALRLAAALISGAAAVCAHASFRSPNLKARLGSARDEFRALWRGYQQSDAVDYTL